MVSEEKSNRKPSRIRTSAVDLLHLRYALAAADHGSFRRAAEVLLLQQSTLSRCISQLEHSLGMTVFERSSGGVRATTAGRHFLQTARSIVEQMDSLVNSTYHVGRGEAGRLSVGFYTSISAGNLLATLVDFKRRFSQIDVCLKESSRVRWRANCRAAAM
jgi:DNA-binding transcriptional LysR family regulator